MEASSPMPIRTVVGQVRWLQQVLWLYGVHRNDAGTYQPSQPRPVEFWIPSGSAIGCSLINATKCSTVNAGPGLVRWGTLCVGRWRTELLLPLFFLSFPGQA